MTDFIHEHHKDELPETPPALPDEGAEDAPLDEKVGQKRVYGYIFILFIVAFALLLWSFLMNQRSTDQVLSELRGNANSLQSMLERNGALEQEVDALEAERDALEEENEALREQLEEAQGQAEVRARVGEELSYTVYAMNYLAQIERAVAEENDEWARHFIAILEHTADTPSPLKDYLPNYPLFTDPEGNDAPSPAERYEQLVKELADN